ncbi:uncharacterized protein LOC135930094 [Gordionus sp. m RMFG-2023]|uniref:uncharacterized protein LOC135930094 n=1 Tax=Gordionus sp. m RMFG-2023 TaxID=3053472 RepID=UPI0031FE0B71
MLTGKGKDYDINNDVTPVTVLTEEIGQRGSKFPRLHECAHFHYDYVEIGAIHLSLIADNKSIHKSERNEADNVTGAIDYEILVVCGGRSWVLRRDLNHLHKLDQDLHVCSFDRRYSALPLIGDISSAAANIGENGRSKFRLTLNRYFGRLSVIVCENIVNCVNVLNWFEMDNKGNHLQTVNDIKYQLLNTQAIAAAIVTKRYAAKNFKELSLEVGDIISITDMSLDSSRLADLRVYDINWWKGKKGFNVGYFPNQCVQLYPLPHVDPSYSVRIPHIKHRGSYANDHNNPSNKTNHDLYEISPHNSSHTSMNMNIAMNMNIGGVNTNNVRYLMSHFLPYFLEERPTKPRLRAVGILKERVFGCDLGEYLLNNGHDVPPIVQHCCDWIERHGVIDGIYRLSGVSSNIQKLRNLFDEEKIPPSLSTDRKKDPSGESDEGDCQEYCQDIIHSYASALKMYFRELPNPLLTFQLYNPFLETVQKLVTDTFDKNLPKEICHDNHSFQSSARNHNASSELVGKLKSLTLQLPPPHFRAAKYLFDHLHAMAQMSGSTNMHCKNLAIVWAPNLLRSRDMPPYNASAKMPHNNLRRSVNTLGANNTMTRDILRGASGQALVIEYLIKYCHQVFIHEEDCNGKKKSHCIEGNGISNENNGNGEMRYTSKLLITYNRDVNPLQNGNLHSVVTKSLKIDQDNSPLEVLPRNSEIVCEKINHYEDNGDADHRLTSKNVNGDSSNSESINNNDDSNIVNSNLLEDDEIKDTAEIIPYANDKVTKQVDDHKSIENDEARMLQNGDNFRNKRIYITLKDVGGGIKALPKDFHTVIQSDPARKLLRDVNNSDGYRRQHNGQHVFVDDKRRKHHHQLILPRRKSATFFDNDPVNRVNNLSGSGNLKNPRHSEYGRGENGIRDTENWLPLKPRNHIILEDILGQPYIAYSNKLSPVATTNFSNTQTKNEKKSHYRHKSDDFDIVFLAKRLARNNIIHPITSDTVNVGNPPLGIIKEERTPLRDDNDKKDILDINNGQNLVAKNFTFENSIPSKLIDSACQTDENMAYYPDGNNTEDKHIDRYGHHNDKTHKDNMVLNKSRKLNKDVDLLRKYKSLENFNTIIVQVPHPEKVELDGGLNIENLVIPVLSEKKKNEKEIMICYVDNPNQVTTIGDKIPDSTIAHFTLEEQSTVNQDFNNSTGHENDGDCKVITIPVRPPSPCIHSLVGDFGCENCLSDQKYLNDREAKSLNTFTHNDYHDDDKNLLDQCSDDNPLKSSSFANLALDQAFKTLSRVKFVRKSIDSLRIADKAGVITDFSCLNRISPNNRSCIVNSIPRRRIKQRPNLMWPSVNENIAVKQNGDNVDLGLTGNGESCGYRVVMERNAPVSGILKKNQGVDDKTNFRNLLNANQRNSLHDPEKQINHFPHKRKVEFLMSDGSSTPKSQSSKNLSPNDNLTLRRAHITITDDCQSLLDQRLPFHSDSPSISSPPPSVLEDDLIGQNRNTDEDTNLDMDPSFPSKNQRVPCRVKSLKEKFEQKSVLPPSSSTNNYRSPINPRPPEIYGPMYRLKPNRSFPSPSFKGCYDDKNLAHYGNHQKILYNNHAHTNGHRSPIKLGVGNVYRNNNGTFTKPAIFSKPNFNNSRNLQGLKQISEFR